MEITKEHLDVRICDFEKDSGNTQTFREFIIDTENDFDLVPKDLEDMTDKQLNKYLDFLDYLWEK